jgi:hypothetical protein
MSALTQLARHGFNFIRVVVFRIVPPVLDSDERDRAKVLNDGIVGDKAVSAVRRLDRANGPDFIL